MTTRSMIRALGQSRLAWLVFLAGMAFTTLAWYASSTWGEEKSRQGFAIHVNDTLVAVRQRLDAYTRKGDTVARLGGDEFLLLMPKIKRLDNLIRFAQKVLDSLRLPAQIEKHQLKMYMSIGISVYPVDGDNPDVLIKRADEAMYQAKQNGRNKYHMTY